MKRSTIGLVLMLAFLILGVVRLADHLLAEQARHAHQRGQS